MRISRQRLQEIIKEEISKIVTPVGEEIQAMFATTDLESGPQKVKQMKDYEDGVHTGTASLVDVIDVEPEGSG